MSATHTSDEHQHMEMLWFEFSLSVERLILRGATSFGRFWVGLRVAVAFPGLERNSLQMLLYRRKHCLDCAKDECRAHILENAVALRDLLWKLAGVLTGRLREKVDALGHEWHLLAEDLVLHGDETLWAEYKKACAAHQEEGDAEDIKSGLAGMKLLEIERKMGYDPVFH